MAALRTAETRVAIAFVQCAILHAPRIRTNSTVHIAAVIASVADIITIPTAGTARETRATMTGTTRAAVTRATGTTVTGATGTTVTAIGTIVVDDRTDDAADHTDSNLGVTITTIQLHIGIQSLRFFIRHRADFKFIDLIVGVSVYRLILCESHRSGQQGSKNEN